MQVKFDEVPIPEEKLKWQSGNIKYFSASSFGREE